MKAKIGSTAGKVWETLNEKGEVDISRLPKILKEKTLIVYQAVGWLAREDKVEYRAKGEKTYVRLAEHEAPK